MNLIIALSFDYIFNGERDFSLRNPFLIIRPAPPVNQTNKGSPTDALIIRAYARRQDRQEISRNLHRWGCLHCSARLDTHRWAPGDKRCPGFEASRSVT